jgi:hypothetical protein
MSGKAHCLDGQRVILARNLLGTLRNRELAQVAKDLPTAE